MISYAILAAREATLFDRIIVSTDSEQIAAVAGRYDPAFADIEAVRQLKVRRDVSHAYHLYAIRVNADLLGVDRSRVFAALRAEGIGVNVHYIPVHLHPFYRQRFKTSPGMCLSRKRLMKI